MKYTSIDYHHYITGVESSTIRARISYKFPFPSIFSCSTSMKSNSNSMVDTTMKTYRYVYCYVKNMNKNYSSSPSTFKIIWYYCFDSQNKQPLGHDKSFVINVEEDITIH